MLVKPLFWHDHPQPNLQPTGCPPFTRAISLTRQKDTENDEDEDSEDERVSVAPTLQTDNTSEVRPVGWLFVNRDAHTSQPVEFDAHEDDEDGGEDGDADPVSREAGYQLPSRAVNPKLH